MSKVNKVDLTLIKKFISSLEQSLAVSDEIRTKQGDVSEYLIELSRAAGIASGIMQEAGLLVADIQSVAMMVQNPKTTSKSELMDTLLSSLSKKTPGSGSIN
jgi:hypothetical protein